MKVTIFIEKKDFDEFFKWMNRIDKGIIVSPPVRFSHRLEGIRDPLRVSLDSYEYALIQNVESDIEDIQKAYGPITLDYSPLTTSSHLLIIKDVARKAEREDLLPEVIYLALKAAIKIPGLTPTEAIVIAENESLRIKKRT